MDSKCKDCTRRHQGCHVHCEDYKAYKEYLEEKRIKESANNRMVSYEIAKAMRLSYIKFKRERGF